MTGVASMSSPNLTKDWGPTSPPMAGSLGKRGKRVAVRAPSDMITVADSRSDAQWDTAIDPADRAAPGQEAAEWPSRRHSGGANFSFADGHSEYGDQAKMVSSRARGICWNSDNQPHLDLSRNRLLKACPLSRLTRHLALQPRCRSSA